MPTGIEIKTKIDKLRKMGAGFGLHKDSARREFNQAAAMLETVAREVRCPDCLYRTAEEKESKQYATGAWNKNEVYTCPACGGIEQAYPEV